MDPVSAAYSQKRMDSHWCESRGYSLRSLLLGSEPGGLLSLAVVSLVNSFLSKLLVHLGVSHLLGDGLGLASSDNSRQGKNTVSAVLSGALELVGRRVGDLALLWPVSSDWEENHLSLVLVQSLDVLVHGVGISVVSSVVDSDTNGSSESLAQLGSSKLVQREASTVLDLGAILPRVSEDDGSQQRNGSWTESSGLLRSSLASNLLVSGSIEEAPDSAHPVFPQVGACEGIIVTYHVAY